jgi:hypothetical protein
MAIKTAPLMYFHRDDFSARYGDLFFTVQLEKPPVHGESEGNGGAKGTNDAHDSVARNRSYDSLLGMLCSAVGKPQVGSDCCSGIGQVESEQERKEAYFYPLEIRQGTKSWVVLKRFSDFLDLVVAIEGQGMTFESFSLMPQKTFFAVVTIDSLLERRDQLQAFLDALLMEMCEQKLLITTITTWLQLTS